MSTIKETCDHSLTLRKEMEAWIDQSVRMDPPSRHGGGEDEANYALAWFPHYLVTRSEAVRAHFNELLDQLAGWVERECHHGYEKEAEAHHGTEPFLLFLPRYLGLFPDDDRAAALLEDAAHHIGNWVDDVPDWYDYDNDRFIGYRIGTVDVDNDVQTSVELAEHFRFLHIALAAHRVTGQDRYYDWAIRYGRKRAERILAVEGDRLPLMWTHDHTPVFQEELLAEQKYMGAGNHHVVGDPLVGVEVLLASGALYAFGDLFRATSDDIYRDAARRIVEPLINELLDPYCDPGAAALSYFRETFFDDSLDPGISKQIDAFPAEERGDLGMVFPEHFKRVNPGVGKRQDMTYWGIWNERSGDVIGTVEPCTAAHTLAYQITGNIDFARRALGSAARKLAVARRTLRGGREHADMGRAVCSTAAGHGRNWGWGAVTGCYGPLMLGTREIKGAVESMIEVESNGQRTLPEDVLTLVRPGLNGEAEVTIYNGGEKVHKLTIHTDTAQAVEIAPDESVQTKVTCK